MEYHLVTMDCVGGILFSVDPQFAESAIESARDNLNYRHVKAHPKSRSLPFSLDVKLNEETFNEYKSQATRYNPVQYNKSNADGITWDYSEE